MARARPAGRDPERPGVAGAACGHRSGPRSIRAARADARAPLDADLRQQPPHRRAAGRRAQRAGRARRSSARTTARSRAPQRIEIEDALKAGQPARRSSPPRRSSSASTWARSIWSSRSRRRRRSRAACSASAAAGHQRRRRQPRHHLSRSTAATSSPAPRSPARCSEARVEATRYPAQPARRARAADRRHGGDGRRGSVDELFAAVRGAAPFAELSRGSSRACSTCSPAAIRPTSSPSCGRASPGTGSRTRVTAREGAKRVAVVNGGTIPDRGLYGVFLAGAERGPARVGELDEEMVFESRVGETFLLGASTWRIEEITHDRVLVSPAPGEPGKMPFWKGDAAGRPLELGRAIGALVRELAALPRGGARRAARRSDHDLDPRAAENLLRVPRRPEAGGRRACPTIARSSSSAAATSSATGACACSRRSAAGCMRRGRWRSVARIREETGLDVETMWTDDGFVVRFPETDEPPDPCRWSCRRPTRSRRWCCGQLGSDARSSRRSSASARRARCCCRGAGPAGARRSGSSASAPPTCWPWRRASARSRCCSRPTASACATCSTCRRSSARCGAIASARDPRRRRSTRESPSPFAASLLFGYVANYIYDGDAPLAERRAQALAIDQAQLRELLGDAELRELLDADAIDERRAAAPASRSRPSGSRAPTALHDLLLRLGDLSREEMARASPTTARGARGSRRSMRARGARSSRSDRRRATLPSPVEDAAPLSRRARRAAAAGLPEALLEPVRDAARRSRAALRAHARAVHDRRPRRRATASDAPRPRRCCTRLASAGRLLEGEFRPGGTASRVVRPRRAAVIRRRSLARLRHEVEPVEAAGPRPPRHAWQGVDAPAHRPRRAARRDRAPPGRAAAGLDPRARDPPGACRGLQPCRSRRAGRRRRSRVGAASSRSASATAASRSTSPITSSRLWRRPPDASAPRASASRRSSISLATRGASFFAPLHEAAGGGFPPTPSTRCGSWSGGATSPTTRCTRCAPISVRPAASVASARRSHGRLRASAPRLAPPAAEGPLVAGAGARRHGAGPTTEWSAGARPAAPRALRHRDRARSRTPSRSPAASARSTTCCGRSRNAGASAAATSPPASARRSSRCPARSTCCARCAYRPRSRRSSSSRRPIRPTRTARSWHGRRSTPPAGGSARPTRAVGAQRGARRRRAGGLGRPRRPAGLDLAAGRTSPIARGSGGRRRAPSPRWRGAASTAPAGSSSARSTASRRRRTRSRRF